MTAARPSRRSPTWASARASAAATIGLAAGLAGAGVWVAGAAVGCARPNQANAQLRRENQSLRSQVADLRRSEEQLRSRIRQLEIGRGTLDTLPGERLDLLWTTAGLTFGRLTGFDDNGTLRVYLTPADAQGDNLKAAGAIRIELFDLRGGDEVRLGLWDFPAADARRLWQRGRLFNGYVLPCKLNARPRGDLLVKATFEDVLTGNVIEATQALR